MKNSEAALPNKMADFFSSPVKTGSDGKQYRLEQTSVSIDEALTLRELVQRTDGWQTLEIGLALGGSAVAIAETLLEKGDGSKHVALDPYQRAFGYVGTRELERLGLNNCEVIAQHSEDFLPEAARSGRRFDLIFDDGSKTIGQTVTNTFFADRCLKVGGVMAYHDAFIPSTVAAVRYLVQQRSYEVIPLRADSRWKRFVRMIKWTPKLGPWFTFCVAPNTCRYLVALRKTSEAPE